MKSISDLESAIRENGARGLTLYFGPSVGKSHAGQFFANTGPNTRQVHADSLQGALTDLFAGPVAPADDDDEDDLL